MSALTPQPASNRSLATELRLPEAGYPPEPELELRDLWRVVRTRWWLIATFLLTVVGAVAAFTLLATPIYTAETLLLIERRPPQVMNFETVLAESLGPDERGYYTTQYEILQSRSLASQVIREQRLYAEDVLWDPAQGPVEPDDPRLVGLYTRKWLTVEPLRNTRLVRLRFGTPDPELSARALAAHARAYVQQGLSLRTGANEEARSFLEERLSSLQDRVEGSEAALNAYRRDHGILSLDPKENVIVERLADLNKRLTEVEAERIGLEAHVQLIRLRSYDSLPAVIQSPLIATLKQSLSQLQGEQASLATQFKPGYPRLARIRAQAEETRRRLQKEIRSIVEGIESAYLAALGTEDELRVKMEEQKAAALAQKDASVEYTILQREVDTNRELYDSVLQRMKEMGVAAELRASNVFVIDEPQPPLRPSSPRKLLNLSLALLFGLVGGVAGAFVAERLDDRFKTPREAERHLRLPNLGVIPNLNHLEQLRNPRERRRIGFGRRRIAATSGENTAGDDNLIGDTESVVSEAYRSIRTAILLSQAGEPPRTILFTSATGGEGKTVTTLNTAILFAQLGPPVLVIDADLRRPRCHEGLGIANDTGLTEVLTGQVDASKAIHPTQSPLAVLPSGMRPPNPAELLGSLQMRELLASMQRRYSYVLIDAPPIMPVSDSLLLSTLVDGVVLVVDQPGAPRRLVRETQLKLASAGARVLGVVLNRADFSSPGYSDYLQGYYS